MTARDQFDSLPLERFDQLPPTADRLSNLTVVAAGKGGSGCTFVAANLGTALSVMPSGTVALVDLDLSFGTLAATLSMTSPPGDLRLLAGQSHRLDASMLEAAVLVLSPRLALLAGAHTPSPMDSSRPYEVWPEDVQPDDVFRVLDILCAQFDHVIVDIGRSVDVVHRAALSRAGAVALVAETSIVGVEGARRWLRTMDRQAALPAVRWLIANRCSNKASVTPDEARRAIDLPLLTAIDDDAERVRAALEQGVSIFEIDPKGRVATAMRRAAVGLSHDPAVPVRRLTRRLTGRFGRRSVT